MHRYDHTDAKITKNGTTVKEKRLSKDYLKKTKQTAGFVYLNHILFINLVA